MITSLLTALLLTQGVQSPGQFETWSKFDPFGAGSSAVLSLPLTGNGAYLADSALTVAHVVFSGSTLVDDEGPAGRWTENGTVPRVASTSSPFSPGKAGAGPYSAANSFQGPTTLGEWTGDWSATVVFVPTATGSAQRPLAKWNATSGWIFDVNNAGTASCYIHDGAVKTASAAGTVVYGAVNVLTCGRSGGVLSARLNNNSVGSVSGVGTMTSSAAIPIRIGRSESGGSEATGTTIYEVIMGTEPYSDALHAARWRRAVGLEGARGETITSTRATTRTCEVNGTVWSVAADAPCVNSSGLLVESARTNYVLQSSTISTGTAATSPWVLTNSTVATGPDTDPGGAQWAKVTNTTNSGGIYQSATTPATTTMAVGVTARAASGTQTVTVVARGATSASGCWCAVYDVATRVVTACTPLTGATWTGSAAQDCSVKVSVGTSPTRIAVGGTTASTVSPTSLLIPSDAGTATGTAWFSQAQLEVGATATSYVPTTGTATARAADVVTVPTPSGLDPTRWCVEGSFTPYSAWSAGASSSRMISTFAGTATNSVVLYRNAGGIVGLVYDSSGGAKQSAYTTGFTDSRLAKLSLANQGGNIALRLNGAPVGTISGAGTGIQTSFLGTIGLGSPLSGDGSGASFDGYLSNFKLYRSPTCR